jgi:hypothetical protein
VIRDYVDFEREILEIQGDYILSGDSRSPSSASQCMKQSATKKKK